MHYYAIDAAIDAAATFDVSIHYYAAATLIRFR